MAETRTGKAVQKLRSDPAKGQGEKPKAEALFNEIKAKYPDAVDHGGKLLVDSIKAESK